MLVTKPRAFVIAATRVFAAIRTLYVSGAGASTMALCTAIVLAGCTYDVIDHLYEEADMFKGKLESLDVEEGPRRYPDLVKKEDYNGKYTSHEQRRVVGRRKMEKDFIAVLKAKCPTETFSCAIGEVKRLGFRCSETSDRAECISERRTRNPRHPDPLIWDSERQLWTVVFERQANGVNMQARLQYLGP